jgi:hypothetical protein
LIDGAGALLLLCGPVSFLVLALASAMVIATLGSVVGVREWDAVPWLALDAVAMLVFVRWAVTRWLGPSRLRAWIVGACWLWAVAPVMLLALATGVA